MRRANALGAIGMFVAGWLLCCAHADVIYIKDGRELRGQATEEDGYVVIQKGTIRTRIRKDKVLRIQKEHLGSGLKLQVCGG